MNRYRVIIQPNALRRIESAFEFIHNQSPENGVHWLQGLFDSIDTLETFPSRCGFIREQEAFKTEYRELLYKSHRIIFTIDEESKVVKIPEFRHAAQADWKTHEP